MLFFPKLDRNLFPRYIPPVVAEHESVQNRVGWTVRKKNVPGYMSANYMRQVMGMVRREQDIIMAVAKGELADKTNKIDERKSPHLLT